MTVLDLTSRLAAAISVLIVASATMFALMGVDDLILDAAFWIHKWYRWLVARRYAPLTVEQLRSKDQQRVAIFIPCWHEHDIVDKMVELTCGSLQYARYDLFIGVYPNDPLTVERAKAVAQRYPRVKVVVNDRDGPTTKAQNLNCMWNEMLRKEGTEPYDIVVLHDVEDVIHPLSLLLYNYLIPRRDMVQLPVFPLERPWNKWTTWTYADEFAENHLKDLVARESFGSFVPCAGVGCAFRREALETKKAKHGELFPTDSLTEDYQLGLHFRQSGLSTIIVHQRLGFGRAERVSTAAAYVATREFFPDTFSTAIRQKARWIVGICFQAWQQTGWTGNIFTRYTLYRDRKAIAANLLVLVGYVAFAAALALAIWGRFDPLVVEPHVDRAWWPLLLGVLSFTFFRAIQKAYFVFSIYGPLQGILAIVRIPWSGIINAAATARACWLFFRSKMTGAPLAWSKTAHVFPTRAALSEYRRQLGDVLIEQELVNNEDIAVALEERREGERIGETLVRLGYLTQRQLMGAVAKQIGAEDGTRDDLMPSDDVMKLKLLQPDEARRLRALPIRVIEGRVTVAVDDEPSNELDTLLKERLRQPYTVLIVETGRLLPAIERTFTYGDERRKPLGVYLLDRGWLTRAQLETALAEQDRTRKGLFELVVDRGFLTPERMRTALKEYFGLPYVRPSHDAKVAADCVAKIPTRVLRDNVVVPYEADGSLYVASQFPLDRRSKEAIAAAVPAEAIYVAASLEDLTPLRREVLKLVERRKQIGRMLVDEKLVTNEDVARALEARAEGERLGETLVRLGILTEHALKDALARQNVPEAAPANGTAQHPAAARRKPIGVYLLEKGFLTRQELDELLQHQDRRQLPLFAMAVEDRLLTPEQVTTAIREYFEAEICEPPAQAPIPLEYLKLVPTGLLQELSLALYESDGKPVLGAPYPLPPPMREAIVRAAGEAIEFVLCSPDVLAPIRRRMLREIDENEIYCQA
jgi:adsorption protein B